LLLGNYDLRALWFQKKWHLQILTFTETSKFAKKQEILAARMLCVLFLLVFVLEEAYAELPRAR
jgi:hypothetical protein